MQVRNLRNRLRVNMVCEWAWVSIPGEHDLIGALAWSSGHTYRYVRTQAHRKTRARTPYMYYHGIQTKIKADVQ